MHSLPLLLPLAQATVGFGPLLSIAVYSLAGIALAIVGYKLFDLCTPGDLHEEILKNRNTAAAMVASAVILGVSLIVAAAIVG